MLPVCTCSEPAHDFSAAATCIQKHPAPAQQLVAMSADNVANGTPWLERSTGALHTDKLHWDAQAAQNSPQGHRQACKDGHFQGSTDDRLFKSCKKAKRVQSSSPLACTLRSASLTPLCPTPARVLGNPEGRSFAGDFGRDHAHSVSDAVPGRMPKREAETATFNTAPHRCFPTASEGQGV